MDNTEEAFSDWLPDARWMLSFRKKLLRWYENHGRTLPWRGSTNPYHIWVSEVMLQQTTTTAVIPYYERFLVRYPTVQDLANASLEEIQRLWEGLGYYRRAKQLHAAAKTVVEKYGGYLPDDYDKILGLPGIGRYTAGAILSLGMNRKFPILEANTIRLHARLLAYPESPTSKIGNRILWRMAEKVLPKSNFGAFNQALMDLGSLICTPKNPGCRDCPVSTLCESARQELQDRIPVSDKEKIIEIRHEIALIIQKNGKYLLIQYPEEQRWGGLWDFPRHNVDIGTDIQKNAQLIEDFKRMTGYECRIQNHLTTIHHVVTRFKITLFVHFAEIIDKKNSSEYLTKWLSQFQIHNIPLNSTARRIVSMLASKEL